MNSYRSPHMAGQKQDDQLEHTYSSYVGIRDVPLRTCLSRWTIGRSSERGSGISVLAARHYDDDDDGTQENDESATLCVNNTESGSASCSFTRKVTRGTMDSLLLLLFLLRCWMPCFSIVFDLNLRKFIGNIRRIIQGIPSKTILDAVSVDIQALYENASIQAIFILNKLKWAAGRHVLYVNAHKTDLRSFKQGYMTTYNYKPLKLDDPFAYKIELFEAVAG